MSHSLDNRLFYGPNNTNFGPSWKATVLGKQASDLVEPPLPIFSLS